MTFKYEREIWKWEMRYLRLAEHISTWSKDPSTQVGAVIVEPYNKSIVSVGFNGFAQGVEDTYERLNNRDLKYKLTVHAERNAIIFAQRSLASCEIYTWPFMPCSECAAMIIQAGISTVVAPINNNPRWVESFKLTEEIFEEASVALHLADLENNTLSLWR